MADGCIAAMASVGTTHLTSTNLDHARSALNRFYYPTIVGAPDGVGGFELDMQVIRLGPLTLGQLRFGAPVTLVASDLDAYHVIVPTIGRVHTRHAGHEVAVGPATAAVFGPCGGVSTLHDAYSTQLGLKIERSALEADLTALLGRPVQGPIDLPPALDLSTGPGLTWRRLVHLLRDELTHAESLIRRPLIAEQLWRSVLSGLLLSVPHRHHAELTAPAPAGPPRAIRRTLDAIHDQPGRPYGVATLAEIAGLSVRSLQEGFRRHVGCAPMAYLRQVRLDRAHAALLAADPARTTVAAVAHRWGFTHLGRFASSYRARFGGSPSDTLHSNG
jgi:AraC-like DNA-binding protein